ncbi:hypothetical protein ABIE09_001135 [Lysobacter enzymogenes]|uniref:DUF4189 domain-containing protein n=1 Tax=Lysobacter enzymogenes TaxID=69 RepID=UPI003391487E
MKSLLLLSASTLSLLVLTALPVGAQAGESCPQGMITNPIGAGGQPQCVPGSNYQTWGNGSSPSAPSVKWAKRFGAVVYDPATGAVGVSSEEKSKRKAFNTALAQCKSKGGTACVSNIEYFNQCVASATGPTSAGDYVFTSASAAKEAEASTYAMEDCKKNGVASCKIFYSGCSYPEQVN